MRKEINIRLNANRAKTVHTGHKFASGDKGIVFRIAVEELDLDNTTAKIVFKRSNGTSVEADISKQDGVYSYTTVGNEFAVVGQVAADVKFYEDGHRISTCTFTFDVMSDTMDGLGKGTGGYSDTLEKMKRDMNAIKTELEELYAEYEDAFDGVGPLNPRGEYSPTASYKVRDMVGYGAGTWVCYKDCTGATPGGDSAYWQHLSIGDAKTLDGHVAEFFATYKQASDLERELLVEKRRIDMLSANNGEQTEGNAELLEIRVGANGYVYDNAGEAVRDQFTKLSEEMESVKKIVMTENLFNKDTCVTGMMLAANDVEKSDARFFCSDYIKVEPGAEYTISAHVPALYNYYDCDKTYLGAKSISATGYDYTFTTEADAYYIRFNGIMTSYSAVVITPDEYMLVKGNKLPEKYAPYGEKKSEQYIKKIVCFGDSITQQDGSVYKETHAESGQMAKGYQSYLRELLGATVITQGYIGHTMPGILPYVKAYDYEDVDCVTLTAGANDFRYSGEELGSIAAIGSTFDETTYIGSFQSAIEHILNANPRCRVVLVTPIKGYTKNGDTLRVMPEAYPDALKEIADLYSLPLCDWYYHSGINDLTLSVYNGDSEDLSYKLHPTNEGYKRMGIMLANTIKNI